MTKQTFPSYWLNKPYYSLDAYCKHTFGYKCYKIALDAHMSCPNRDGTIGTGGCIFCSASGSGDFAISTAQTSIDEQLAQGLALLGNKKTGTHYIAYFQAFTNTYAPVDRLREIYSQALLHPSVCGISIATRPDCLPEEVLDLLTELGHSYPNKFIWIELGLQSIHESTALFIQRGYALPVFADAFNRLQNRNIPVIVHVILGLPGETPDHMYATIQYLNQCKPFGIKLQLLHVLKGTALADLYLQGHIETLSMEAYLDILIHCLELVSPDIVIHRVTGDGPRELTLAPTWSFNKREVLNSLHRKMRLLDSFQGRLTQL